MDISSNDVSFETIEAAAQSLRSTMPSEFIPEVGIICGSGLSTLERVIQKPRYEVPYSEINGFPVSTVHGHAGILIFGYVGSSKTPAVLMNGRAHYYEGNSLQKSTFPIRVLSLLGMKKCIITNAAGGLDPAYKVGDVVVIHDHINFPGLAGLNPLRGPNLDSFGPRFIALSDAYDLELRRAARLAWKELSKEESKEMVMHEGVYACVGGPNYETRAECRMLALLGADLVGMSTVPEIIVARHCNIRVLVLSLVTNTVVKEPGPRGDDASLSKIGTETLDNALAEGKASHDEVLTASHDAADEIKRLVVKIIDIETR